MQHAATVTWQVLFQMIGRKGNPKGLLCIVIHVVIAMPGSSNFIKGPVGKQTGTPDSGFCSTIEEIKIPVPD